MMKTLLLFVCLLIPIGYASAQKDTTGEISVNKLVYDGFWLTKGWKFHTGDDPAFADPAFNDASWQGVDPTLNISKLPTQVQHGIGWMRIKLHVTDSVWENTSLRMINTPAMEVYLDGQLLCKRGTINSNLKTARGYFDHLDPVPLPSTNKTDHVIAIRYCVQPDHDFFNWKLVPVGFISIQFLKKAAFATIRQQFWYFQISDIASASVLFLLAIFHFTLYRYNRSTRGNLYFAAYALCFGLYLITAYMANFDNYMDAFIAGIALGNLLVIISLLFCLKAIFTLFNFNSGKFFRVFAAVVLAQTVIWLFVNGVPPLVGYGLFVFILLIEFWLTIKAIWLKRRGANIIAVGFFAALFCAIVYEFTNTGHLDIPFLLFLSSSSVIVLGPVLAISIYLGREFALDGLLLQAKLSQVEELSAKTLAQEQEKQTLLAKQNELLEQQVNERTSDLNQSLTDLKATQAQLIQAEKMASLGELTAGIAHEIQNPLNFVNNFSEVNREMIDELKQELKGGNMDEALAIADDIGQNEEKINHHGKRADAIVKGMLQHSQSGGGAKELTSLNDLVEECMRLAYHGFRAKDTTFNVELITHLDETSPKVNVIPQDMGRVMLNLFNNAFYAVNQQAKTAGESYKPTVEVETFFLPLQGVGGVKVKDNGVGIPDAIKDKIMQPFFTTKPTGEGTGLGLSLTYDMVVKGHGGSILVNSVEGEGSEFIIHLPLI